MSSNVVSTPLAVEHRQSELCGLDVTTSAKPQDSPQWDTYRAKRNAVRSMLRKAEASYWIGLFEESSSPKDFWKISNRILGKSKDAKIGPLQDANNTIITDDTQKANLINNYFIDIAHNLTKNLDPVHLDTTCYINRITPTLENFSLNWDLVSDALKSINPVVYREFDKYHFS